MKNRIWLTLTLGLLAAILAAACAPAAPKPLTKVRYGQVGADVLDYLPYLVAREKGFFREEGLDMEVIISEGGSAARDVLVAGDTDITITGMEHASALALKGTEVRIIGDMTVGIGWSLVARKDLGIKSVPELKGKSVAITRPGSLTHILSLYAAQEYGMTEKDMDFVAVGPGAPQLAALKGKKVDAAMLFEPFLAQALDEGLADEVYDVSKKVQGYTTTHFTTKKSFVDKNPEVVKAFRRAIQKGLDYIRSNKDGAFQVARKAFQDMSEPVLKRAYERYYPIFPKSVDYTRDLYDMEKKVLLATGLMKEIAPYEMMQYKE